MKIRYVNPSTLLNHPFSIELYGLEPDPDFIDRVRAAGQIKEAIRLLPGTLTVVSGHRRRQAAIICGIDSVPVLEDDDLLNATEAEIRLAIVNYNDQREKTNEQRAREFEVRAGIHTELAKERERGGRKIFSQGQKGKAAALAAAEVGMSRPTAKKAVEVAKAIDEARAAGDEEKADDIADTLNSESVEAAHRKVKPREPKSPKVQATEHLRAADKSIGALMGNLYNAKRAMVDAKLKPIDIPALEPAVKQIYDSVQSAKGRAKAACVKTEPTADQTGSILPPRLAEPFEARTEKSPKSSQYNAD